MKTTLLLALALFAGCIDQVTTEAASDTEIPHDDAAGRCVTALHLPTEHELTELLGDCVANDTGMACTPCSLGSCAERFPADDTVSHGRIWSSTSCQIEGGGNGFLVADLELGHIRCEHENDPVALPLCVR